MPRVLVCGGRDYGDRAAIFNKLDQIHADSPISAIIHGACQHRGQLSGADRWAEAWAVSREVPYVGVPARWTTEGNAAGPRRNGRMIEKCLPDIVLAAPGGRGTADMVRQAKFAGIEVVEVMKSN